MMEYINKLVLNYLKNTQTYFILKYLINWVLSSCKLRKLRTKFHILIILSVDLSLTFKLNIDFIIHF